MVAIGYSIKSLPVLMTLAITLVFSPPLSAALRLPLNSIGVGTNSFAIAAACHASPLLGRCLSSVPFQPAEMRFPSRHSEDAMEMRHLMAPSPGIVHDLNSHGHNS